MRSGWLVNLTDEKRTEVEALTRRGRAPARKVAHAQVLLLAAEGLTDDKFVDRPRRGRPSHWRDAQAI